MQRTIRNGGKHHTNTKKSRSTTKKSHVHTKKKKSLSLPTQSIITTSRCDYMTLESEPLIKPAPVRKTDITSNNSTSSTSNQLNLPLFIDKDSLYKTEDSPEPAYNTLHKFSYDIIPSVLGATPNPQINSRHPYLNLYLYTSPQQWQHYLDKTIALDSPWVCFAKELEFQQKQKVFNEVEGGQEENGVVKNTIDNNNNPTQATTPPSKADLFSYDQSLTAPLLSQVTLMTNVHTIDKEIPSFHNQMGDIVKHRQVNSTKNISFAMPIQLNVDNYDLYRNYHLKHFHHVINGNYNVKHTRIFNPRYITTLLPQPTPFELPTAIQRRIDKNLIYVESKLETFISNEIDEGLIVHENNNDNNSTQQKQQHSSNNNENDTTDSTNLLPQVERFQLLGHREKQSDPVHESGHNRCSYDVKHNIKITVPLWFHQRAFLPIYVPERLRVAQELSIGQYHDEYLQYKYDDFGSEDVVGNIEIDPPKKSTKKSPFNKRVTSSRPKFIPSDEYFYDRALKSYYPLDKTLLNNNTDVIFHNMLKFATIPSSSSKPNQFNTRQVTYQFELDEEYYPEFQSKPTWSGNGMVEAMDDDEDEYQGSDGNPQVGQLHAAKHNFDNLEPAYLPEMAILPDQITTSRTSEASVASDGTDGKQSSENKTTGQLKSPKHRLSPITTQDYHVFFSALSKALYNVADNENFTPDNDIFSISLPNGNNFDEEVLSPEILRSLQQDDESFLSQSLNRMNNDNGKVVTANTTAASATVAPVEGDKLRPTNERNIWKIIANVEASHQNDNKDDDNQRVNDNNRQNIRLFSDWFHHLVKRDDLGFIKSPESIPKIDIERF